MQMAIAAIGLIGNQTEIITKLLTICLYDYHAFYELYNIEDITYLFISVQKKMQFDLPKGYLFICTRIPFSW